MTIRIIDHAPAGWCAACMESWRPDMIAVSIAPMTMHVCGECVMKAAELVIVEKARRADDDNARRGQDAR